MKKLMLLAVLMIQPVMYMYGTCSFSSKKDVVYLGATEVKVLPLTNENGKSPENVEYALSEAGLIEIDAETGIINIKKEGNVTITASYVDPDTRKQGSARYELIMINPVLGQYRKVTDISVLESGDNDYIVVNKLDATTYSYLYTRDYKSTQAQRCLYLVEDGSDNIYPQTITATPYKLKLNDVDIDNDGVATVSSMEYDQGENSDEQKYVSYPTSSNKQGALIVGNTPRTMTISYNDNKGIKMSFNDTSDLFIGYSKSNFQNLRNQTSSLGLYKHYSFKIPGAPIVKIDEVEVTDNYKIDNIPVNVAIEAPNENVIVYYNWEPSGGNNVSQIAPEVNKWTKYLEPIHINGIGILQCYSEQHGLKSEVKAINFTITTAIEEVMVNKDSKAKFYTLDGQKLAEKPGKAGVYVVLKEGKSKKLIIK